MRIMLAVTTMTGGGAERVAATLVNHWSNSGHEVALITVASVDLDFYPLDRRVSRIALDLSDRTKTLRDFLVVNFKRINKLRSAIRCFKPEIIVSFLDTTNVRTLIASIGTGTPVIVSERSNPRQNPVGRTVNLMKYLLYRRAAAVVVLTPAIAQWARSLVRKEVIHVIPNPVSPQFRNYEKCGRTANGHRVIAIGRLEVEKGFDILLEAFARCSQQHHDWTLTIVGEGSERDRLKALAMALRIDDLTSWQPAVKDPENELHLSDLFVLSSRYEGFPNVLVEAMACGLPVVSFDCPTGPADIIHHGEDGLLVKPNDIDALAQAMSRLMSSADERKRLGKNATRVLEQFSLAKIADMWSGVFEQVLIRRWPRRTRQARVDKNQYLR